MRGSLAVHADIPRIEQCRPDVRCSVRVSEANAYTRPDPRTGMGQADDVADTDRPGDVLTVADLNRAVSAVIEDTEGLQEVRCLGLVTSADGDPRDDIQEAVHSRYFGVDILVQDARVQGERAPTSLANAIRTLDRQTEVDVIVLGRGGGSETDLAAFDTEAVAEAVFTADTPVVAAVGHRDDEPLVYQVADATAITPTEADAAVVPDRETVADRVTDLRADLDRTYRQAATTRLDRLGERRYLNFSIGSALAGDRCRAETRNSPADGLPVSSP